MRLLLLVTLALAVMSAGAGPSVAAPSYDRVYGNLLYRIPSGYRAAQQQGGLFMARQDELGRGELSGVLIVPQEIPLAGELARQPRAALAAALAATAGQLATDPKAQVSPPRLTNRPQDDGYEVYEIDSRSFDASARRERYARTLVVFVKDRIHLFIVAGYGTERAFQGQLPGFAALVASGEFRNQGRPLPPRQPPLPASLVPVQAAAPQRPGTEGGRCRIVQRQMCSGGVGTSLGYFCNTYPQRVCD
jgi:hypothetical protein